MALHLGHKKGTITQSEFHQLLIELDSIPEKIEGMFGSNKNILKITEKYGHMSNFL